MKITFLGGTETVTGSKFHVKTASTSLLVDCGLFQGYKWLRERNRTPLPVDLGDLDGVLLTHAHLDHSGYIPVLYKAGYRGPVFTHSATKGLASILLQDSGHIQEEDAKYHERHKLGKHAHPEPLYDRATAQESMSLFEGVEFGEQFSIGDIRVTLQPVGHILGAASILLEAEGKRVMFSGDVGRPDDCLMQPPALLPEVDHLILESTYGNRRHESEDVFAALTKVILQTTERGGVLLVPSFAVGRSQALMHVIATLQKRELIPRLPVYLDSPMAINVSDIYCEHASHHRLSTDQCHEMCNVATYTRSVDESKALADQQYPHVIIAGSGMATGGRILHHFKRLLGSHRTTVLFTGYQAGGTRGAKMLDGAEEVKIHGEWYRVRANLATLNGLSGHADFKEMGDWLAASNVPLDTNVSLVHGSPDALEGLREHLGQLGYRRVEVAEYQRIIEI